jgi:hypothetical protein
MGRKAILGTWLVAGCLAVFGCGGNPNPVPVISSLAPNTIPAGEGAFTLSITGTNMNGGSTVMVGTNSFPVLGVQTPENCPTQTNCPVILVVSIPGSQVSAAGSQFVNVTTLGQTSNDSTLFITTPQILTASPISVPAGSASFPLTLSVLYASPFVQVTFGSNQPLVPAGLVSCVPQTACTVTVNVPASYVTTAGTVPVTVSNPFATSGGATTMNFMVTAASSSSSQFPIAQSASSGTLGNASSTHSSVSDGGLFVAFDSTATNLTSTSTNGLSQVYLQQNCFGSGSCTPSLTLISAVGGAAGAGGVNGSDRPVISSDGRYIAFESDDTNLSSSVTTPVEQIYLYDTCNGISGKVPNCTPQLTLVSANGTSPGNAPSMSPTISSFGLFVAYHSSATNLTSATVPANVEQVYLYQNCTSASGMISGCTPGTTLLSTDANGNPGDGDSVLPSIDPAGLAVSFESLADNIVSGVASNGSTQIYLRTTCLEAASLLQAGCPQQTVMVSADPSNAPGAADSITPTLTDGEQLFVAFASSAPNLLPSNASGQQILGETVCVTLPSTVSCAPSGIRVLSVDQSGAPGVGASSNPAASGMNVVFTSQATLITTPDTITGQQVYGVTTCLVVGQCSTAPTLISQIGGAAVGGDFGAIGGGGMATFSTMGAPSATGIGEIYLAAPF